MVVTLVAGGWSIIFELYGNPLLPPGKRRGFNSANLPRSNIGKSNNLVEVAVVEAREELKAERPAFAPIPPPIAPTVEPTAKKSSKVPSPDKTFLVELTRARVPSNPVASS